MVDVPIYVLAGQSNAKRAEVGYGVEAALRALGGPHVVVTEAYGGTALARQNGASDWSPDSQRELFSTMIASVRAAMDAVIAAGDRPVLNGFFWVQGENDALTVADARAYAANLDGFIDEVKSELGNGFPIVVAELKTTASPYAFHQMVRDSQHDVADARVDTVILETDAFDLSSDGVHYGVPGRLDLGEALVGKIAAQHAAVVGSPLTSAPVRAAGTSRDDVMSGGLGADNLNGGNGNDGLYGNAGNDMLMGSNGNDRLFGGAGNDSLYGGSGHDFLFGGAGADRLFGGPGNDVLTGGDGRDQFVFDAVDAPRPKATITDFEDGTDLVVLRDLSISGLVDTPDGARLTFDNGASVVLTDIAVSELSEKDFVLQNGADFGPFF